MCLHLWFTPMLPHKRARDVDADGQHNSMQMHILKLTPLEIFPILKFILLFVFFLDVEILIQNFFHKDAGQIRYSLIHPYSHPLDIA